MSKRTEKIVEKKFLFTFILITALFALWGFANDITNPMVAAFQTLMELSAFEAAACGAFLHGKAGDLAAEYVGEICMNAEDIISFLPLAFKNALEES
jgi:NAD(P)H-hydrate repair Nnr-like enzyme with NAD(P)H-hydrate dehydratase domain